MCAIQAGEDVHLILVCLLSFVVCVHTAPMIPTKPEHVPPRPSSPSCKQPPSSASLTFQSRVCIPNFVVRAPGPLAPVSSNPPHAPHTHTHTPSSLFDHPTPPFLFPDPTTHATISHTAPTRNTMPTLMVSSTAHRGALWVFPYCGKDATRTPHTRTSYLIYLHTP